MSDDLLTAPISSGMDWKGLMLHLLIVFPYGVETHSTQWGEKQAVRCDIYDVDSGAKFVDSLVFGTRMVSQLAGTPTGKAVVGRVTQGQAKGGNNPPWLLDDPTPQDFERARAYLAANAPRPVPPAGYTPPPPPSAQPQPQPQQQAPQQASYPPPTVNYSAPSGATTYYQQNPAAVTPQPAGPPMPPPASPLQAPGAEPPF